jgi:hypothetical protein
MGETINVYVGSNAERKHLSFDSKKERDKKAKELRAEGWKVSVSCEEYYDVGLKVWYIDAEKEKNKE